VGGGLAVLSARGRRLLVYSPVRSFVQLYLSVSVLSICVDSAVMIVHIFELVDDVADGCATASIPACVNIAVGSYNCFFMPRVCD